ncbi:MAG: hypothetical protein E7Z64_00745 [Thermoplasmata archaeon]|nr:hypothetical protein [Thermoplasmata archaeon]
MIEFTFSRVTLCVCGVILLISVAGCLGGIYDMDIEAEDEHLASRIAHMLDSFESSEVDEMILDGSMILPEGYTLNVHDGFVELRKGDKVSIASTEYQSAFELDHGDVIRITHRRSPRSS